MVRAPFFFNQRAAYELSACLVGSEICIIDSAQARQVIRERQALLDEAEAQASRLIEDARSQAITIASEQEIVRISQQQADTILAEARELERETRAGAEDFADEVFSHVEQSLDTALNSVRRCRDRLNANSINSGR